MKKALRFLASVALIVVPLFSRAQTVVDTVPFFCDFEDTVLNTHWHLENGSCYNFFVIDTSVNTTPGGTKSLYVTEEDHPSMPYSYKFGSSVSGEQSYVASRVFAWMEFYIPDTGEYDIGFWWNCMGETVYDYGRFILAPSTYTFTASTGQWDTSSPYPGQYLGAISTPNNCISLNGTTPLSNVSAPQYRVVTVHIAQAGNYRLGIMWLNDGNTGDNPPLMIDDISIVPHTCDAPENLMVDYFSNDTVFMTWRGTASNYLVMWDTAGVTSNFSHITTTANNYFSIGGLPEHGEYELYVYGLCDGDTSMPAAYHIVMPDNSCPTLSSFPYTIDFDTVVNKGSSQVPAEITCWGHLTNSSNLSYDGYPYVYSYSSYAHTGSYVLYYYYNNTYLTRHGWRLPRIDPSIDIAGLVVSFWAANSVSSYSPRLLVGVMSDPANLNSFVACDTVNISATASTQYSVPLSNYTGHGQYPAIIMCRPGSGDYGYCYVDDITLTYEPCTRPGITSMTVTDTSADFTWAPTNGYYYEWTMSLDDSTDINRTNDTTLSLTGLSPAQAYTLYLRSVCDDNGAWNPVNFRTECGALRVLPYFEDFESVTGGNSTTAGSPFIDCWHRYCDGTSWYPYIYYNYSSYAHSGNNSIYWYRSNTSDATWGTSNWIILPPVNTDVIPMNSVQLKFWAMSSSTSYGPTVQVGVMSNPNDTSTFRLVRNVDIEGTSYREYVTTFDSYTDSGSYITVRSVCDGQYWYAYFDDFTIEYIPSCPGINNLIADGIGTTSIHMNWEPSLALDTVVEYEITITNDTLLPSTTYTTTNNSIFLTGLTPNTQYYIGVRSACDTSYSQWESLVVRTNNLPCIEFDSTSADSMVVTNTSTSASYQLPLNNFYRNSYTQQLFTSDEMHGGAVITGVDFRYNGSAASTVKTNCTIYMANTTVQNLSSGYVPYSSAFQRVYVGPMNASPNQSNGGWNHFEFDTAFNYDGASNLLLIVHDNSDNYDGSTYTFSCHNTDGIMARHSYTDGTGYDIATVSGGNTATLRADIQFHTFGCQATGNCAPPTVVVTHVDSTEISVSWAAGNTESSWGVEYMADGDTNWVDQGLTSATDVNLTGLTPNTRYTIRVTASCGTEAPFAIVSAKTACAPYHVPFYEDFESWTASSTAPAPACWNKFSTYSASYPYVVTSQHHSGNRSMYFYNYGSTHTCLVLPLLDVPLDSLSLSFFIRKTSSQYRHALRVGVMSDPTDISTFELVSEVYTNLVDEWQGVEVPFNSYTGNGQYIAIRTVPGYSYPYVDDIEVDYINPCPRPTNFWVENVANNGATIHWEDTASSNFEIEWGPKGFARGTGTTLTTTADSIDLTGLAISTEYEIYVRGLCTSDDTSDWSFPFSFWSQCFVIDSLPFFENFESYPSSSTSNPNFIHCWTRLTGSQYIYPYIAGSTTYSHNGGNRGLYWYNTNSSGYMYGNTMSNYVILPQIDTTVLPINTLQLSFWAKSSSSSYSPNFDIGIMTDPNDPTTYVPVDTVVINYADDWTYVDVPFTNYTGYGSYVAIRGFYVSYWYAYVDEILLDTAPSCIAPRHLASTGNTLTSIDLTWRERGNATEWQVRYNIPDVPGMSYDTIVYTNSVTFTGLFTGQMYEFQVRSICGGGDTSAWSNSYFGAPGSWNMRPNMTDTLRMCQGTIYDDGGLTGSYIANQTSYIILMPETPGNLVQIEGTFKGESCCDYLGIYDGTDNTGTQFYYGYSGSLINLGPFMSTNGPITIYFHSDGSGQYDGFEFHVSCINLNCPVADIRIDSTYPLSSDMLNVTWYADSATSFEVEYGNHGFIQGTGTFLTTTTNHATLIGLTPLTSYDVYVRAICATGDTGSWMHATLTTELCENYSTFYSYDTSSTIGSTTSSYSPVGYSLYNYSYVQTIIDSATLAGMTDPISALAFHPSTSSQGDYFSNMDVYLANVPESDLSLDFIRPDSNHVFVQVMHGADLRYNSTEWQLHGFDTTFAWDGHSNLLVSFNRKHGSYSSGATFYAHSSSAVKGRYIYQDGAAYNPATVSGGYTLNVVGDLMFYTCHAGSCQIPIVTGITHDHQSATVTWTGNGTNYQVNIKEATTDEWPATDINVTGNTYTFSGLNPATHYNIRVRTDCTDDSLGYSYWVPDEFITDSLPCFPPHSTHVTDVTNSTATIDWITIGTETAWEIHVWSSGDIDSLYRVTTHPVTVGGFTAGLTYTAAVRALCGTNLEEGDWGTSCTFTTATCPNVANVSAGNVTDNSALIVWDLDTMAESWVVEYGHAGFDQGSGTIVPCTSNSFNATGLECETSYDFYVRAVCGTDWTSENWARVSFTTNECAEPCDAPFGVTATVNLNNVDVSWTPGEGNTAFEVEYGSRGFSHGSGTTVNATEPHTTLTGLDYNTQYDLYVRALCGADNYSAWTPVTTFTTGTEGIDLTGGATCTIFPNPASGSTTISVGGVNGKVKIEVVDMNGRTVATETLECNSDCVKTMEVDKLAQGAYFVRISGEQVNMVRKLIVK